MYRLNNQVNVRGYGLENTDMNLGIEEENPGIIWAGQEDFDAQSWASYKTHTGDIKKR